ncbi:hypothetical protein MKY59_21665 [Paenibacillus sp. FSL W8-0426]|uniref:hypothetical protein n=1 Tax=Paenibacillus sp. FSL W8-0426 TaxID=2921714 RepID=UPI0030D9F4DA
MVDKKQLNIIAIRARQGDEGAMWEVKYHFQSMIHRMSEQNRNRIVQADFEDECFKIIEDVVHRFDEAKGDIPQLVVNFIKRRLGRSAARYKKKTKESVNVPMEQKVSDDGYAEYEIVDDLAIVDRNFLFNERITGLAAGDSRKLAILNTWSEPGFNNSETAKLLAQQCGGNPESHRKFIVRFRSECQKALANAV